MTKEIKATTLLIFFLTSVSLSCSKDEPVPKVDTQYILGRVGGDDKTPLYRIKVPCSWRREDPPDRASLTDTTEPLCQFFIDDGVESIRLTIHNFPVATERERVPPMAQVARWKRQFDRLDPTQQSTTPQSFSGYVGLLYEGKGTTNGKELEIMGWAMQIGEDHFRTLTSELYPMEMRADFTIKGIGPSASMQKHRPVIHEVARSFELVEEIPSE